jgi:hypothetical protein
MPTGEKRSSGPCGCPQSKRQRPKFAQSVGQRVEDALVSTGGALPVTGCFKTPARAMGHRITSAALPSNYMQSKFFA